MTVPTSCVKRRSSTTNTKGTIPTYPRSADCFLKWDTFLEEVDDFYQSKLASYLDFETEITVNKMIAYQGRGDAGCESDIESSIENTTFKILYELLRIMDIKSSFPRGRGESCVILEPDFIWKFYRNDKCKGCFRVPIEVKPFWTFPVVRNLAVTYQSDLKRKREDSIVVRGVNQIYGYSSFNYSRYSALTTQHELYCFKRIGNSTLIVSDVIPLKGVKYQNTEISFFTCWLFLLYNARENGIFSSPDGSPVSSTFSSKKTTIALKQVKAPKLKLYSLREIKADQIYFSDNLVIGKGAVGSVISGKLFETPEIKFKLYDVYHDDRYIDLSKKEVKTYKKLKTLQGSVIPTFHGYFNYHGIIILALEDCGEPLTKKEYERHKDQVEMGITEMKAFGVVHEDLELRNGRYPNILKKGDQIRIIDFHL